MCPPPAPATLEDVTALAIPVCPRTRHLPPDPDFCLRDTSRVAQSCSLRRLDLPPHVAGRLVRLDLTDNELTAEEVQPLHSTAPWLRVLDITGATRSCAFPSPLPSTLSPRRAPAANNVRAALTALPPKLLSLSLAHNPLGSVEGPLIPPSQRLRSLSLEGVRPGLRPPCPALPACSRIDQHKRVYALTPRPPDPLSVASDP